MSIAFDFWKKTLAKIGQIFPFLMPNIKKDFSLFFLPCNLWFSIGICWVPRNYWVYKFDDDDDDDDDDKK